MNFYAMKREGLIRTSKRTIEETAQRRTSLPTWSRLSYREI